MRRRYLRTLLALAAILVAGFPASASAKTFAATPGSLGAIPDGLSGNCASPTPGAPRIVKFPVKGLKDTITSVEVAMTFASHPWAGDVTAVLIAPNSASQTLFARTGSTSAAKCGDGSDLGGPYTFSDVATLSWWTAASSVGATDIPSGSYRSSGLGGPAASSAPGDTLITPAFAGVDPNGVWSLVLNDSIAGDAGSISGASLTITAKDTIDPQTTIVRKPAATTRSTKAAFRFRSSEAGLKFRCRLGTRPWKDCTRSTTLTVGRGKHTLRVRAIDQAGNRDETPAVYIWRVE